MITLVRSLFFVLIVLAASAAEAQLFRGRGPRGAGGEAGQGPGGRGGFGQRGRRPSDTLESDPRGPAGRGRSSADDDGPQRPTPIDPAAVAKEREGLEGWMKLLRTHLPSEAAGYGSVSLPRLQSASAGIQEWTSFIATFREDNPVAVLRRLGDLLAAKAEVDRLLTAALRVRSGFAELPATDQRRTAIVNFLKTTTLLIDLSGRLRYQLQDAVAFCAGELIASPTDRQKMLELLTQYRSGIGATIVASSLFDSPEDIAEGIAPLSLAEKSRVLKLIALTRQIEVLPTLVALVRDATAAPALRLQAAMTIREVGLPQERRADQDPALAPAITAQQLYDVVARLESRRLSSVGQKERDALLEWLDERARLGVRDSYRIGPSDVRPGDWLLMRNPSPYNLFTDLSPGLFTHVGVVASERGADGIERMVIVDMPERGSKVPATNVDAYLRRTLNYVFVRHKDPEAGKRMGEVAAATIGNPSEFDLSFRTDRVAAYRGKKLAGEKIATYCAGYLLLCAQETGLPREQFFPIAENPAGGNTVENIGTLGLSLGESFISPTGALFSPHLEIVGRREPMYDPRREVEEAIFDHFAHSLVTKTLSPSEDLFQGLRSKLAAASKSNPLLAQALAKSAGVSEEIDLVAAARAAAVVETLDEIAFGNSAEFLAARTAILATLEAPDPAQKPADAARAAELRKRHANLAAQVKAGKMTPRALRVELVKYYTARGRQQLNARFFAAAPVVATPDSELPPAPPGSLEPSASKTNVPKTRSTRPAVSLAPAASSPAATKPGSSSPSARPAAKPAPRKTTTNSAKS